MKWFDSFFEFGTRRVAQHSSRRGALARVGKVLVASAFVLPVLPFDRVARASGGGSSGPSAKPTDDPTQCDYWRYCGVDGFLCSCCGGSASTCPPGTEPAKASWLGTCRNPHDGRDYIVNYQDCCGKTSCGKCLCNTNVGERPGYRMQVHNDVNWCMANDQSSFHCTVSVIVGLAGK
jgi:methylamine dehydrogenase light chain